MESVNAPALPATPAVSTSGKSVAFADPVASGFDGSVCSRVSSRGGGGLCAAPTPQRTSCSKNKGTLQTMLLGLVGIMFGLSIMYLISRIMALNRKIVQLERDSKRQVTPDYVEEVATRVAKELTPPPPSLSPPLPLPRPRQVPVPLPTPPHARMPAAAPVPVPAVAPTATPTPTPTPAQAQAPSPDRIQKPPAPAPAFFDMSGMMPMHVGLPPELLMDLFMGGPGMTFVEFDMSGGPRGAATAAPADDEPRITEVFDETIDPATATKPEPTVAVAESTTEVNKLVADALAPLASVVNALEQESNGSTKAADSKESSDSDEGSASDEDDDIDMHIVVPPNATTTSAPAAPTRRSGRRAAAAPAAARAGRKKK